MPTLTATASGLALLATFAAPPREPLPAAPGGYWSMSEQRERQTEPDDGEEALTIGSVLFSLGLLRGGAGAATVFMAGQPQLCPSTSEEGCRNYAIFGWLGVAEGGLMFVTGAVYLAIGGSQRARHDRWERGESASLWTRGRLRVSPWLARRGPTRLAGGGLRLELRF